MKFYIMYLSTSRVLSILISLSQFNIYLLILRKFCLEKIICAVQLYSEKSLIGCQYHHNFECRPQNHQHISLNIIYSFHLLVLSQTKLGLISTQPDIWEFIDLKFSSRVKNIFINWVLLLGRDLQAVELINIRIPILIKVVTIWSVYCFPIIWCVH